MFWQFISPSSGLLWNQLRRCSVYMQRIHGEILKMDTFFTLFHTIIIFHIKMDKRLKTFMKMKTLYPPFLGQSWYMM
jgi:hypothetical protein